MWVTGASSGIGRAIAEAASSRGARIILSGRRRDALESVKASLPGEGLVMPFEATDYEALEGVVDEAWSIAPVDILVNNAGISQRSLAEDTKPEVYRDLIDIDLIAPIWLTQLQLPRMIAAWRAHCRNQFDRGARWRANANCLLCGEAWFDWLYGRASH